MPLDARPSRGLDAAGERGAETPRPARRRADYDRGALPRRARLDSDPRRDLGARPRLTPGQQDTSRRRFPAGMRDAGAGRAYDRNRWPRDRAPGWPPWVSTVADDDDGAVRPFW
jgi:hypothetical protein